jgi:hypothetical protein
MRKHISIVALVIGLIGPVPHRLGAQSVVVPAAPADARHAFDGLWLLNRDKGPAIARSDDRGERRTRSGGGRSGRGGQGGGGGRGGQGGFGGGAGRGGTDAASREAIMAERQALLNYLRTLAQPSTRLTITVRDASVMIMEADGFTQTLLTDNKWVDGRAENGLVRLRRRARWAPAANQTTLVSEIELEQGQMITRTWTLANGGTELHLNLGVTGMSGGPSRLLEYMRPVE